jgi:hypothetical protein
MAHLGITVTQQPDGTTTLSGWTYDYKEQIKTAGGRWNPDTKIWTLPAGVEPPLPPPAAPVPPPPKPRPRSEWSMDEYQNWLARSRKKFHGACCGAAVAYESHPYGPICYRCVKHGQTINDYTGD